MANRLYKNATYDSFGDFDAALEEYCANTMVNGQPVGFVTATHKPIKDTDYHPASVMDKLKYKMISGRCKFRPKNGNAIGCHAQYKIELRILRDGKRVLRLVAFDDVHENHPVATAGPSNSNRSGDADVEIRLILANIYQVANQMTEPRRNATVSVLQNLLTQMQGEAAYQVNFVELVPGKTDNNNNGMIEMFSFATV